MPLEWCIWYVEFCTAYLSFFQSHQVPIKKGKESTEQKSKLAVKSVSFGVPNGQVFGLLGPNGAGKTTTMKMITAEENPSRGQIKIGPYQIKSNDSEGFEYLGYCPQVRR